MASTALEIFNEQGGKLNGEETAGLLMAKIFPHSQTWWFFLYMALFIHSQLKGSISQIAPLVPPALALCLCSLQQLLNALSNVLCVQVNDL